MSAAETLSRAIELYAQSHGLSIEEAQKKIALNAETLAIKATIALGPLEMRVKNWIAEKEAAGVEWTMPELARAFDVTRQSARETVQQLKAKGALITHMVMRPTPLLKLADAKFVPRGQVG